jgi:hypothetical protein
MKEYYPVYLYSGRTPCEGKKILSLHRFFTKIVERTTYEILFIIRYDTIPPYNYQVLVIRRNFLLIIFFVFRVNGVCGCCVVLFLVFGLLSVVIGVVREKRGSHARKERKSCWFGR